MRTKLILTPAKLSLAQLSPSLFFNSSLCLSGNRILGKHLGILSVHQTMHQPNGLRHMTLQTVRDFVPAELCPMGNWS